MKTAFLWVNKWSDKLEEFFGKKLRWRRFSFIITGYFIFIVLTLFFAPFGLTTIHEMLLFGFVVGFIVGICNFCFRVIIR